MVANVISPEAWMHTGTEQSAQRGRSLLSWFGLAATLAINWWLANALPGGWSSATSVALFVWLLVLVGRASATGLILLLPLVITRGATLMSLIVIEQGAYMPEIGQMGQPGDATASFVAFTAIFFAMFALVFRVLEPASVVYARSPLLDRVVQILGWPMVLASLACVMFALLHGVQAGFPLLQGIDRFLYRREYSSPLVSLLLDNKFLIALVLGSIAFSQERRRLLQTAAKMAVLALTAVYFLYGDKFFTTLTQFTFFLMPMLLAAQRKIGATLLRALPLLAILLCVSSAATLFIYSDYGRLPLDRAGKHIGERIAGQGQLWFVANRDDRRLTNWDTYLVGRNLAVLDATSPPASAFAARLETYYFIQRYSPPALADSFGTFDGWVQLAMGTEAMALVMFGYVGVGVIMAVLGVMLGLVALYVRRTIASAFPLSQLFAVWTYLQVYFATQQASLWPVAAPGQINRLLLFLTIEIAVLAINRGQMRNHVRRRFWAGRPA